MRLPFVGNYPVTQGFGGNAAVYKRFGLAGHNGVDYALPSGTEVKAAHAGKCFVGYDPSGYGHYIYVNDGRVETVYAHLLKTSVVIGQTVKEGQGIGFSDNSGFSSAAHLHFGIRPLPKQNNGYGGYVDPIKYMKGATVKPNRAERTTLHWGWTGKGPGTAFLDATEGMTLDQIVSGYLDGKVNSYRKKIDQFVANGYK